MGILNWLISRAPTIETPAPEIRNGGTVIEMRVPANEVAETPHHAATEGTTRLSDIFCAIEYCDAEGFSSRRRVTMLRLATNTGHLVLHAICHERQAFRNFRVDRIESVITEDGEVLDPATFFSAVAGVDITVPVAINEAEATARKLRDHLRPAFAVLISAARSDDHLHATELDAILSFAETEALFLYRDGKLPSPPSIAAIDLLQPMLATLRPQAGSLKGHFVRITNYDTDRLARLARAINKVMHADGQLVAAEVDFVQEMNVLATAAIADRWTQFGIVINHGEDELFWLT